MADNAPDPGTPIDPAPPPGGPPGAAPPAEPPTSARERQQKKKGSIVAPLIVVIVVLIAGGFAAWWFLLRAGGGPGQVVTDFVAAEMANDFEAMKLCVTADGRQKIEQVQAQIGDMQLPTPPSMAFTVGEATITDDEASVDVTVKLDAASAQILGRPEITQTVLCTKEEGAWKVDIEKTAAAQRLASPLGPQPPGPASPHGP